MDIHTGECGPLWSIEDGIRSPGAGVTGCCKPPNVGSETYTQVLFKSNTNSLKKKNKKIKAAEPALISGFYNTC